MAPSFVKESFWVGFEDIVASLQRLSIWKEMAVTCVVCGVKDPKYKCPRCKDVRYCSVVCCKEHKNACTNGKSGEARKAEGEDADEGASEARTETKTLSGIDLLKASQMKKLETDPYIRKLLGSKRLQGHIRSVDEADDRPEALKKLRKNNKEFHEFVGNMLDAIATAVGGNEEKIKEEPGKSEATKEGEASSDDCTL